MATATKATGFKMLTCPFCGQTDDAITLELRSMDVTCSGCNAEFTVPDGVEKAREALAEWERLAQWVETSRTV
jgi:transposase-like protein